MRIEGEIFFSEEAVAFVNATVIIRVEDVRYADASAVVVAEQRMTNISLVAGDPITIPFHLECKVPLNCATYSLRVHVDVDLDAQVSRGDYVTTQSYPLNALQSFARILVHPVN